MSPARLWAAGGVLWRVAAGDPPGGLVGSAPRVEVALVHRPRYDDWSLPKGKAEPGEHLLQTAVREVREETGHHVALGWPLPRTRYAVGAGTKTVRWWSARSLGGTFQAGDEVDQLRWLAPEEALGMLTHRHDEGPLWPLVEHRPPTATVLLVRHARAGRRGRWPGPDATRPLDPAGTAQAERLGEVLAAFAPARVLAADLVRCIQTVAPLAKASNLPVETAPALSDEAWAQDEDRAVAALRALAVDGTATVVCSQGSAVPGVVAALAHADGVSVRGGTSPPSRKGSTWVLGLSGGALVRADYLPDLAPVVTG